MLQYQNAVSQSLNWVDAELVYNDSTRVHGLLKSKKGSCFAYMKFKVNQTDKAIIVHPDDVYEVHTDAFQFYSIRFQESEHFITSSSFGILHGGNTIKLLETTFFYKTCSCNSRGSYRHGYFLWCNNDYVYVKLKSDTLITNTIEINVFLAKHGFPELEKMKSYTLPQLLAYLQ